MLQADMQMQLSSKSPTDTPVRFGLGIAVEGMAPVYLLDDEHYTLHPQPVCYIDVRHHRWFADHLLKQAPAWILCENGHDQSQS